ncbi:MAG TPA: response regulator transcription factor [Spongiibacteraceae bacterium]|nr:response regulator transcription factor [Spongiibacteraceae bacterium]
MPDTEAAPDTETGAAAIDILVVDDDQSFCQVLQRALGRRGLQVICAHDLASASTLVQQHRPRRALIDLKLADGSGLHVISTLKLLQPDIAIVMLTGYSSIATAVEAVKRGANNYLCKPVSVDEILDAFTVVDDIAAAPSAATQPLSVERLEWEHIQKILLEHAGNVSATARALGMHRRTLQRKLQKRPVRQ